MLADVGHIIVVDDDATLRQMVVRYLEEHDVSTRAASNRAENCTAFSKELSRA